MAATGAGARAGPPQQQVWGLGLSAGPSFNLLDFRTDEALRGGFAFAGSRTFKDLIDVELVVGGRFAEMASHLDLAAGTALRKTWGRFAVVGGARVGVTIMHVSWQFTGELWTWALLTNLGVGLRVGLWGAWEVRARPISLTLYWNKAGFVCWEPSLGIGYRF